MEKAALFLLLALVFGWCKQEVQAQEQENAPDEKVKITIHQKNGEIHVYEYDSREEMHKDERLKALQLPLFPEDSFGMALADAAARDRFMVNADRLRLMADSLRGRQFRIMADSSLLHGIDRAGFSMIREMEGNMMHRFRMPDSAAMEQLHQEMKVFRFHGMPFSDEDMLRLKEMPEDVKKMLQARGLNFENGQQVICFSLTDSIPLPPVPPLPPTPAEVPGLPPLPEQAPEAPDADGEAFAAPTEAPDWLEELRIYPNPAGDQVQISFKTKERGAAMLRLIDLSGKLVYEEKIPAAGSTIERTVKIPHELKGTMVLQIQQEGKIYSRRVVLE